MLIAATQSHSAVIWGATLIVLGIVHFFFREFYARRDHAMHDARQATAPRMTRGLYRDHSDSWYLRSQYWVSALFIVFGILYIALDL